MYKCAEAREVGTQAVNEGCRREGFLEEVAVQAAFDLAMKSCGGGIRSLPQRSVWTAGLGICTYMMVGVLKGNLEFLLTVESNPKLLSGNLVSGGRGSNWGGGAGKGPFEKM